MKSRAFTLVELLVVVAILGLLLALLAPQLSRARHLAKQAVCAHHLEQLNTLFPAVNASPSGGIYAPKTYVAASDWPGLPYEQCPKQEIFMCPEDGDEHAAQVTSTLLYYSWWNNSHPKVPLSPDNQWVKSRHGSDGDGPYTEFTFGDTDGEVADWSQDFHDGLVRVYDNKVNGKVKAILLQYYCGAGASTHNALYMGDQIVWDFFNYCNTNLPSVKYLNGVVSSYGINPAVNLNQIRPGTVVLLDFVDLIANPAADTFDASFQRDARHMGKMNVLFSDGSVRAVGQTALNPKFPGGDVLWVP